MEPKQNQKSPQRPPVRRPTTSAPEAPHQELKDTALSLKDSSLGYMQAKAELAAIEAKEAATYAKKKISVGVITAFFATFSYALFLVLIYGIILQYAGQFISKISNITTLNDSNTVILLILIFNLTVFITYLLKLSKKSDEELFALTKSEFQKDKQWLAEINQTHGN